MSIGAGIAKVIVAPDRLTAWMWLNVRVEPAQVTPQRVQQAIEESRIAQTPAVAARVEQLNGLLASGAFPEGDFLLAQGAPPEESVDARFEWDPLLSPQGEGTTDGSQRVSHYDRSQVISVHANQSIGRIIPARQGTPGTDVYGNPVAARSPLNVQLRGNVRLDIDGQTIQAEQDGQVIFEDNRLSVVTVLEICGDVDFGTGNIDSSGDVIVRGTVKDLFQVRTDKDLVIDGHVEAATLQAGGNITIQGGIHGREKGTIKAGGTVQARLCDGVTIDAGNTFTVQKECINSVVRAENKVHCPAGTIIGGQVWGRNSVEVQDVGSPARVKTSVLAGVPLSVIEEMSQLQAEMKKRQDAAAKIRESIAPLIREMRRLSPQHRERATELMFQADQLDLEARQMQSKREDLHKQAAPQGDPYVLVSGRLHTGSTITISGRSTTIDQDVRGPVRILERKIDGVTTLVLVDQLSGSIRALQTGKTAAAEPSKAPQPVGAGA